MTDTTTTLTLDTPVPANKADTLAEIASTIQASPLSNSDFANLAKVAADVATTTAAGMTGNPVTITTTSLNLFTDLLKLGPDLLNAWNGFMGLFHKKVSDKASA
jgi:hypothetical protein